MMPEAGALDPADETCLEYQWLVDPKYLYQIRTQDEKLLPPHAKASWRSPQKQEVREIAGRYAGLPAIRRAHPFLGALAQSVGVSSEMY